MFAFLVLTFLFVVVAGAALSGYLWLLERRRHVELRNLQSTEPVTSITSGMILGPFTPVLAEHSPMADDKQAALRRELREAGYYQPQALVEYRAVRAVLVLLPLALAGTLALLGKREDVAPIAILGVVIAGLGFALPRVFIQYRARVRAREIERGLPVVIDLLGLALSGGQNLYAALGSVTNEIDHAYPLLAEELRIVRQQAELSSLHAALEQFAERTNHPDVRNLAMVLSQSERLGTDVAAGLHEYGNSLRLNMRQRAEAAANRASFWMLFPTILCLAIPAALLLISPVYLEFAKRRDDMRKTLPEATQKVESLNRRGQGMTPTAPPTTRP